MTVMWKHMKWPSCQNIWNDSYMKTWIDPYVKTWNYPYVKRWNNPYVKTWNDVLYVKIYVKWPLCEIRLPQQIQDIRQRKQDESGESLVYRGYPGRPDCAVRLVRSLQRSSLRIHSPPLELWLCSSCIEYACYRTNYLPDNERGE